jgi:hypothetical protein
MILKREISRDCMKRGRSINGEGTNTANSRKKKPESSIDSKKNNSNVKK